MNNAIDPMRLFLIQKALNEVRLSGLALKRIRRDYTRSASAVLQICIFRNDAQPRLDLAVTTKRIKMGIGAVEGLCSEFLSNIAVTAKGKQIMEHERAEFCKNNVKRIHTLPLPSQPFCQLDPPGRKALQATEISTEQRSILLQ